MHFDVNVSPLLIIDNFLANFDYDDRDWAAMTASRTQGYYVICAVRSLTLTYDCWEVVGSFKHQKIAREIYINVRSKPIPRDFRLIPVNFAFGDFGVYQKDI